VGQLSFIPLFAPPPCCISSQDPMGCLLRR
jgi:hypothetical protein